jgi:hypothetical protein
MQTLLDNIPKEELEKLRKDTIKMVEDMKKEKEKPKPPPKLSLFQETLKLYLLKIYEDVKNYNLAHLTGSRMEYYLINGDTILMFNLYSSDRSGVLERLEIQYLDKDEEIITSFRTRVDGYLGGNDNNELFNFTHPKEINKIERLLKEHNVLDIYIAEIEERLLTNV